MAATLYNIAHATWMNDGACQDEDPDLFFPISVSDAGAEQVERALAVCDRCEVADFCLRYALKHYIKYGIWGGRTEQQRQSMIRARRRRRLALRTGRGPGTRGLS
jgi:WhiB family transcriptional regulator, redox-sensing transcriptional regulator